MTAITKLNVTALKEIPWTSFFYTKFIDSHLILEALPLT